MQEFTFDPREALRSAADTAMQALAEGPVARHIVAHLRRADDAEVETLDRLCHTIGPSESARCPDLT